MSTLSELNERLAAWQGARAEVWDYTAGHSILRLHLSRGPSGPSALLYMYACGQVSFSHGWEQSAISVGQPASGFRSYLVTDGSNLRVECGNVVFSSPLSSYSEIPLSASDPPPTSPGTG
jgi:hypothetical protein